MTNYCLQPLVNSMSEIPFLEKKGYSCGNKHPDHPNNILLLNASVSEQHCLFLVSNTLQVIDLQSSKGTFINGIKIEPNIPTEFHENDIIGIGCRKTINLSSEDCVYRVAKYELKEEESYEEECINNLSTRSGTNTEENSQSNQQIDHSEGEGVNAGESEENSQRENITTTALVEKDKAETSEAIENSSERAQTPPKNINIEMKKTKKNGHSSEETESKNVNAQKDNSQEGSKDKTSSKSKDKKREQKKKSKSNNKQDNSQGSQSNSVTKKLSVDATNVERQDKDKHSKSKTGSTATTSATNKKVTNSNTKQNNTPDTSDASKTDRHNKVKNIKNKSESHPTTSSSVNKQLTNNEERKCENSKSGVTSKNKETEKKKSIVNSKRRGSKESKSTTDVEKLSSESPNETLTTQNDDKKKRKELTSSAEDQTQSSKRHKSLPENSKNETASESKNKKEEQEKKSTTSSNKRRSSGELKRKSNDSLNKQEEKLPRKQPSADESIDPPAKKVCLDKSISENSENHSIDHTKTSTDIQDKSSKDEVITPGTAAPIDSVPENNSEVSSSIDVPISTSTTIEMDYPSEDADSTEGAKNLLEIAPSTSKNKEPINREEKINLKQEVHHHKEALALVDSDGKPKVSPEPFDFLLSILKWKPGWLNNKIYNWKSENPPPFIENGLIPQLTSYKKYCTYYNIMSTFISLELWTCILRDFFDWNNKPTMLVAISNNSSSIPVQKEKLTEFTVEVLCNKEQVKSAPKPENLVILSDKKNLFEPVLAFIKSLNVTYVTKSTAYRYCLKNTISNPCQLITYKMIAKSLPSTIFYDQAHELRKVYSISPFLKMIRATLELQFLPLGSAISDPNGNRNFFSLPDTPNYRTYKLVTGDSLDDKQKKAVVQITNAVIEDQPKICLIDGPPGTGKTKIIINIVTEILYGENRIGNNDQSRILICSSSEYIIDEISMKLMSIRDRVGAIDPNKPFTMVRVGPTDTMHPNISTEISVAALLLKAKNTIARNDSDNESVEGEKYFLRDKIIKIRKTMNSQKNFSQEELDTLQEKLSDCVSKLNDLEKSRPTLTENNHSSEEAILNGANIILCPLSSCYTREMQLASKDRPFGVCIIDEVTLCCEPESLLPLKYGIKQLILVGDLNKLPQTINSKPAKIKNYHRSFFSRVSDLFEMDDDNPITMLTTQYRTASEIISWPKQFYHKKRLDTIAPVPRDWNLLRYQVYNLDSPEDINSIVNVKEVVFIVNLVYTIACSISTQVEKIRIGLITPYKSQRELLSTMEEKSLRRMPHSIRSKIEVTFHTIDESWGQEFDLVILSCVRSKSIELLPNIQQLSHVFTRTKHSLFICGNFQNLRKDETWAKLYDYAKEHRFYKHIGSGMSATKMKIYQIVTKHKDFR